MKLFLLIKSKMPTTTVGILKFICMINKTSESMKARKVLFFSILVFISCSVELNRRKFYNLGVRSLIHKILVRKSNREEHDQKSN